jgi:hypothetical protein
MQMNADRIIMTVLIYFGRSPPPQKCTRTISKQISKQNIKDRLKIDPQQLPIH